MKGLLSPFQDVFCPGEEPGWGSRGFFGNIPSGFEEDLGSARHPGRQEGFGVWFRAVGTQREEEKCGCVPVE